jgi:hypothetical protein
VTWLGTAYDNPLNPAILEGMATPRCSEVRAVQPGSLLSAQLPSNDICRSFFLYRATYQNAAADEHGYRVAIAQDRADEFWQLVGYAMLLCISIATMVFGSSVVRHK